MIQRIFYLFLMRQNASIRRFRYDFAREMVAFLSAGILFALFAHIFHDFLTAKIADLPEAILARFRGAGALAVGLTLALMLRRTVLLERGMESILACARRRGEETIALRIYQATFYGMASAATLAVWGAFARWIGLLPSWPVMVGWAGLLLLLAFRPGTATTREKAGRWSAVASALPSRRAALLRWRLVQMATRLPTTRHAFTCALLGFVLLPLLAFNAAPFALAAMVALAAGMFIAAAFCVQLASDVKQAWAEQAMGVTHQEIVAVYKRLAWGSVLVTLPFTLASGWWLGGAKAAFTLATLGATAPLLTPSLMFQLDARRPLLQILTIVLASLFLGTTVLMHPAGIILLALVIKTAGNYQRDLYYRAKA